MTEYNGDVRCTSVEGIYYIRVVEYSSDERETCNQCLLKVVFSFKFKLTNDHSDLWLTLDFWTYMHLQFF